MNEFKLVYDIMFKLVLGLAIGFSLLLLPADMDQALRADPACSWLLPVMDVVCVIVLACWWKDLNRK